MEILEVELQLQSLYKNMIKYYGKINQLQKAREEIKELDEALIRGIGSFVGNKDEVREEVADVFNMLYQILKIYDFTNEEILETMLAKMERQHKRIAEGIGS